MKNPKQAIVCPVCGEIVAVSNGKIARHERAADDICSASGTRVSVRSMRNEDREEPYLTAHAAIED